jgi:hypothetical protein
MSISAIQAALEKHLATLTPPLATAYENTAFAPVTGTPYQRVHMLVNRPVDRSLSNDMKEERGIFQVSLFFPQGQGRGAAQQRAQAIQDLFAPVQFLTEGTTTVSIYDPPHIAGGSPDGDRWHLPVSVYWRSR